MVAAVLSVLIAAVPVALAIAASVLFARLVSRPATPLALLGWWVSLLIGSTAVLLVVERLTKRLLPLTMLMRMTIVFPDRAPSRFRTAMRASTARSLEKMVVRTDARNRNDTKVTAAQHIIELLAVLGAHDRRTRGHSDRVRAYTRLIADQLPLAPEDRFKLEWAGMLHDIGKLEVSPEILNKTGKPTPAEWRAIKAHPAAANHFLAPLRKWLGPWIHGADQHHEKFDGTGYPLGLAGNDITLAGRVVAVADAFEVMTAARSYKRPMPVTEAREELLRCAGTHFDPAVLRAFVNISLGDLRKVMGPLAILAQLPFLGGLRDIGQLLGQAGPRAAQLATGGFTAVATAAAAITAGGAAVAGPAGNAARETAVVVSTSTERTSSTVGVTTGPAPTGSPPSSGPSAPRPATTVKTASQANPDATTARSTPSAGPPAGAVTTPTAAPPLAPVDATTTTTSPPGGAATTTTKPKATTTTSTTAKSSGSAPVARADSMTGRKGSQVVIRVLVNDSDPDGDLNPFSVTIINGPNGPGGTTGTLTVSPVLGSDVVTYSTPDRDGTFTFRYSVCDLAQHCSTAETTVVLK